MRARIAILLLAAGGATAAKAAAQLHERASTDAIGGEASGTSIFCRISGDARWVVFVSDAPDLVPNDGNGVRDIFVKDRQTGAIVRASVDSAGAEADGESWIPAISFDGRYVAFSSVASNLVPNDTNGASDVFLHDLATGTTERVSVTTAGAEAHGFSAFPNLSADGQVIVFSSDAPDMVKFDTNHMDDAFVHDRIAGTTRRVSVDSTGKEATGGPSWTPSVSADGRYVVFASAATNLAGSDGNNTLDIFLHDRTLQTTELVSMNPGGAAANGTSANPRISADGGTVVFASGATDLVTGDSNGRFDIYARALSSGTTELVSLKADGTQFGFDILDPSVSAAGQRVVFPGDGFVMLRDRASQRTHTVSWAFSGLEGYGSYPDISDDGNGIAFDSYDALVIGDTNNTSDIYVRDLLHAEAFIYDAYVLGDNPHPELRPQGEPVLGSSFAIDLVNPTNKTHVGLLLIGFESGAQWVGNIGPLLVEPAMYIGLSLPPTGLRLDGQIPNDSAFAGALIYLQLVLATHGAWDVSAGLMLQLGY